MKKMIYMGLIFGASAVYMDLRIFEIKKDLNAERVDQDNENIYGQTARYYSYSDWVLLKCYNFYTDL